MFMGAISKQLHDAVIRTMKNGVSCICNIDSKVYSENNASVSVVPKKIVTMSIVQNYDTATYDSITATIDVSVEEAIVILSNYTNLKMQLVFNRVDKDSGKIIEQVLPEIQEYKVIIANASDMLKQFTKSELVPSSNAGEESRDQSYTPGEVQSRRINLELQLFEEDVYEKRSRPVNVQLSKCKLSDGLHCVANALDISDVKITQVSNERQFNNLTIPPGSTLETVFDNLQKKHGIYPKGIAGYYRDKTLYVYPPYETNPDTIRTCNLYKVKEDSYLGAPTYHYDEGDDVHIVLNKETKLDNLSEKTTENTGNYFVSLRADTMHDTDKLMNGKEGKVRNNNLLSISSKNEKMASDNKVLAKFTEPTNNAYTMSSDMSQGMCKVLNAVWQYAWPFNVEPGMKVLYHYEDNNAYKTTTGILSSVTYTLMPIAMQGRQEYTWAAAIMARLTVDTDNSDTVDTNTLPTYNSTSNGKSL